MLKTGFSFLAAAVASMATPAFAATYVLEFNGTYNTGMPRQGEASTARLTLDTDARATSIFDLNGDGVNDFYAYKPVEFSITDASGISRTFAADGNININIFATYAQLLVSGDSPGAGNVFNQLDYRTTDRNSVLFSGLLPTSAPLGATGTATFFQSVSGVATASSTSTTFAATSAVPEPATWAMMIVGFGMAGGALRRRPRVAVAHA